MKNFNVNYNDGKFNIKAEFSLTFEELTKFAEFLSTMAEGVNNDIKKETSQSNSSSANKDILKLIDLNKIRIGDANENTEK